MGFATLAQELPPPGKLIDVNGYKLHLIIEGQGKTPVVMFHGAGDIGLIWNLVLPEVAKFSTAVAVDQTGEGWSDHGPAIHMWQQAYDTREALHSAGIEGPYILVGHSLGGQLVRIFAQMYPDEVAGVVLVDTTHPDVVLSFYNSGQPYWGKMRLSSEHRPIPEVVKNPMSLDFEVSNAQSKRNFGDQLINFSRRDQELFDWIYNIRPLSYVKGRSSFEAETMEILYDQEMKFSFGDKPLIVISKGIWKDKKGDDNWSNEQLKEHSIQLQKDLLKLSSNSKQIIAEKSGHYIHLDEPELVVQAIKEIINQLTDKR